MTAAEIKDVGMAADDKKSRHERAQLLMRSNWSPSRIDMARDHRTRYRIDAILNGHSRTEKNILCRGFALVQVNHDPTNCCEDVKVDFRERHISIG